jgi:predicted nucleic acid-binding Zn ribbon protein
MSYVNDYSREDCCVCCGAYVPEGRQVCVSCEKRSDEAMEGADNKPRKICLLCAYWQPEGEVMKIVRSGGLCSMSGKETRLYDTCWGWKICSPGQLEKRKKAGLIEEVDANG